MQWEGGRSFVDPRFALSPVEFKFLPSFLSRPSWSFPFHSLKQILSPPLVPTFRFNILYIYLLPPTSLSYFPVNVLLPSPCALFFRLQTPSWSQEIFFHSVCPIPCPSTHRYGNTMLLDTSFKSGRGNVQVCMTLLYEIFFECTPGLFLYYIAHPYHYV